MEYFRKRPKNRVALLVLLFDTRLDDEMGVIRHDASRHEAVAQFAPMEYASRTKSRAAGDNLREGAVLIMMW